MSNQYSYGFDPTGAAPANKITEEFHTISAVNNRNYHFVIPKFGPYRSDTAKMFLVVGQTRTPLTRGIDWHPSMEFQGATFATAHPWHGAMSFMNLGFNGTIVLEYQTVGGEYTLDEQAMSEVIANIVYNPRSATWEEVTGLPSMFPPIDHPWNFADMVGQTEVVAAIDRICQVLINRGTGSLEDHLRDFLNPHQVTKAQTGLGNVENFGPAGTLVAIDGQSNSTLITPMTLRAVLDALGLLDLSELIALIKEHLGNRNNPHDTDKFQVGLGQVEDLPVVTPSDITARRRVRKYVTMDMMIDYFALYGCSPRDNGEPDYPPKDALLSTYCANSNNMGVYATGSGGTYEKIIEVNARDCGYVPPPASPAHPPLGTVLNKYCVMKDQYGTYADGYGGSFTRLIMMNSVDCGYTGTPPPPGGNPPAGTILEQHCEGKTLVKSIANGIGGSYDERVPNSPQCENAPTHPPADQLVDTLCDGLDLKGRYTDGNGGYYNAIIERNSSECGYVPPAPTGPPTPTGPPGASAFASLNTSRPVVPYGGDYTLSLQGSGFPPNTQVRADLFGTKPNGSSYVRQNWYVGTTNANGEINHTSSFTNSGGDEIGLNTRYAIINYGTSQSYRASQVEVTMLAQTGITRPGISLSMDNGSLTVGSSTNMRAALTSLEVGQSYTVSFTRKHYTDAQAQPYGNTTQFVADATTKQLAVIVTNVGDTANGVSQFMGTIIMDPNPTLKATSTGVNLTFTANRTGTLLVNNSQGPVDVVIGDTPVIRWDVKDMPISGLSPNNPSLISYWELDELGVVRRAGPYTNTTDSQGRAGGFGPEGIFDGNRNGNRTFSGRYRGVMNWNSTSGTVETVNTNWVTVNWKSPQATPAPTNPPSTGNRTATYSANPAYITPGNYWSVTLAVTGFTPNVPVVFEAWQRFNGNLVLIGEQPVNINSSGQGSFTLSGTDTGPSTVARGSYEEFFRVKGTNLESNHVTRTYAGGSAPSASATIYVDAQPVPNGAYGINAVVNLNSTFRDIPNGEQFTIEYWAHNRATLEQVRIGQNIGVGAGANTGTSSLIYVHNNATLQPGAYDLFARIPSKGVTSNGITTRAFA